MFVSHFFAGTSFLVVVLDRLFFHLGDKKKVVAGHVKQVVVLYSNGCTGIHWGGLSIGCLRQVVALQRWSSEQVLPQCFKLI